MAKIFHPFEEKPSRDDFNTVTLDSCWNFIRNPDHQAYSTVDRPGWLCLKCTDKTLDTIGSPVFIGRRQQHFDCCASTLVDFDPAGMNEEAGLSIFYDNEHHYEIGIKLINGEKHVIVKRRIGDLSAVVTSEKTAYNPVTLQVEADRYKYTFDSAASTHFAKPGRMGEQQALPAASPRCNQRHLALHLV